MQPIPANELFAGLSLAESVPIHAVVTDSRKVAPGCVFVCFPGERVDGHTFAAGAYRDGAAYIVANHPVEGVPAERTVIVPDSALAMVRMASNYRMLFSPRIIGVTGSVGKTTTKEFCYAVLSAFGSTLKNIVKILPQRGRFVAYHKPAPVVAVAAEDAPRIRRSPVNIVILPPRLFRLQHKRKVEPECIRILERKRSRGAHTEEMNCKNDRHGSEPRKNFIHKNLQLSR